MLTTTTKQQGHQQNFKHVRSSKQATCHEQLTVSALLMVTMLVRKACMSSLSSNQCSSQGVRFQLIVLYGNLGLKDEDGGTCAPDVSGHPGTRSN
jgi:hypothetical protein